jgi:alkylation response protein AidB-like acyl-CoA dehydrogenase
VNFDLSPEQYELAATVRRYLATHHPVAATLAAAEAAEPGWDVAAWEGLSALGLAGILVPEEYGGLGLGVLDLAVAAEALGHGAAPGPWLAHWTATAALVGAGSPEQCDRWLPGLADGSVRAALVWDASFVLGARTAQLLVVRVGDTFQLVEADAAEITPLHGVDLTRPVDAVSAPAGEELPGPDAVAHISAVGHVLTAADAFGGSLRALEETVAYVKVRQQWGRAIGQFQAVKHQVVELALLVDPGRGLVWYAAHALDAGLPGATVAAALAKAHVSDNYVKAVRGAIELHGGFGYTWDCDLHVLLKRALLDRHHLGDPESLRGELADAEFGPITEER